MEMEEYLPGFAVLIFGSVIVTVSKIIYSFKEP